MKKHVCLILLCAIVLISFMGCADDADIFSEDSPERTEKATAAAGSNENDSLPGLGQNQSGGTDTAADPQASEALPENGGTEASGWQLTDTAYLIPDCDLDVNGGPMISFMTGTTEQLLDYYQDEGAEGDITLTHSRTDIGGKTIASIQWEILWDAPPDYLAAEQPVSIDVEHKVIQAVTWMPPALHASFDTPDMLIGYASSSPNKFHQPNGSEGQYKDTREEVYEMKVTMTTEFPIAVGKAGDRMCIYLNFGEGYGMRYTYEWN